MPLLQLSRPERLPNSLSTRPHPVLREFIRSPSLALIIANRVGSAHRDLQRERAVLASEIDRLGHEPVMPCQRCWDAKPRKRCVMMDGGKKCSNCVRMGKKCSGPNVAGVRECYNIAFIACELTLP